MVIWRGSDTRGLAGGRGVHDTQQSAGTWLPHRRLPGRHPDGGRKDLGAT